jgi:hypothetical protein
MKMPSPSSLEISYGQTSGGLALLFTVGALGAFLIEMLLASHGIRDFAAKADEIDESAEPFHFESREGEAGPAGGDATPH